MRIFDYEFLLIAKPLWFGIEMLSRKDGAEARECQLNASDLKAAVVSKPGGVKPHSSSLSLLGLALSGSAAITFTYSLIDRKNKLVSSLSRLLLL